MASPKFDVVGNSSFPTSFSISQSTCFSPNVSIASYSVKSVAVLFFSSNDSLRPERSRFLLYWDICWNQGNNSPQWPKASVFCDFLSKLAMTTPIIVGIGAITAAVVGRSLIRRGLFSGRGAAKEWVKGGFKAKMDRNEAINILGLRCVCFIFLIWNFDSRFIEMDLDCALN